MFSDEPLLSPVSSGLASFPSPLFLFRGFLPLPRRAPVDAAAYQRFYVFFVVAGGLLVGASLAKLRRDPSLAVFGGLALMTAAALRLAVASGARRPGKDEGKVAAADQWRHHGFDGGA